MDFRIKLIHFIVLIFSIQYIACKSSKKVIQEKTLYPSTVEEYVQKLATPIAKNYIQSKGNATLQYNGATIDGSIHLQSKKDSITIISLRKFGFEGFRIRIQKDSITLLNRLEQNFSKYSIQEFSEKNNIPIEISYLHDILANSCFLPSQFKYTVDKKSPQLINGSSEHIKLSIKLDSFDLFPKEFSLTRDDVTAVYNTVKIGKFNNQNVATEFNVHVNHPETKEMKANIHWDEINFVPITQFRFEIPSHYARKD